MLSEIFATDSDWVPTLVRIILGIIFFAHGAQKMFGWFGGPGLGRTVRTMTEHVGLLAILASCAVGAATLELTADDMAEIEGGMAPTAA
jgi:putative oxidoreductase